jgi:hypothetical protein
VAWQLLKICPRFKDKIMSKRNMPKTSHVPPTPEEFRAIMSGRMNISAALNEFWRQCTDDELARWFREPARYSYVLRAPNGEIVADGKAKTREECEEWAIRHAEEHVEENAMIVISEGVNVPSFATYEEAEASDFKLDHRWDRSLLGEWRFVLWLPNGKGEDNSRRSSNSSDNVCSHEISAGNDLEKRPLSGVNRPCGPTLH